MVQMMRCLSWHVADLVRPAPLNNFSGDGIPAHHRVWPKQTNNKQTNSIRRLRQAHPPLRSGRLEVTHQLVQRAGRIPTWAVQPGSVPRSPIPSPGRGRRSSEGAHPRAAPPEVSGTRLCARADAILSQRKHFPHEDSPHALAPGVPAPGLPPAVAEGPPDPQVDPPLPRTPSNPARLAEAEPPTRTHQARSFPTPRPGARFPGLSADTHLRGRAPRAAASPVPPWPLTGLPGHWSSLPTHLGFSASPPAAPSPGQARGLRPPTGSANENCWVVPRREPRPRSGVGRDFAGFLVAGVTCRQPTSLQLSRVGSGVPR